MKQKRPKARRLENIRREGDTWDNETNEVNCKMIAPLQPELMPLQSKLQVVVPGRRMELEIPLKSPIIVVTKKATISPIILSQKTSCDLGDLHINDC